MSEPTSAEPPSLKQTEQTRSLITSTNHQSENSNQSLPTPAMASENKHDKSAKDDDSTTAASEELQHTTISDKVLKDSAPETTATRLEPASDDKMQESAKESTPDFEPSDAQDEDMKDKLASPKKKRARATYDDDAADLEGEHDESLSSVDGSAVNGRSGREEPEKKRPRDTSEDPDKTTDKGAVVEPATADPLDSRNTTAENEPSKDTSALPPKEASDLPQTSASAFASSGFGSLASSTTSPFGTVSSSKPSVFGGVAPSSTSGFGGVASAKSSSSTSTTTTAGFGGALGSQPSSGFGSGGSTSSGFGGLGSGSVFGSALGKGFAGGSGSKLSSFAAPSKVDLPASKPAKAFGAPDSDQEDGSDDENSHGDSESDEEGVKETLEEKKKLRLTKVPIEDGESSEATLLQLRAKLFALESKEVGWKERGVGTLKINVPRTCASFDDNGNAIPGSFDISGLEAQDEEDPTISRVPRLIMRQENTHRVVLNTIIVRAMNFEDKVSASAAQIIFTAIEGDKEPKPVNMLFKMSEANARLFRSEISSIQHEL